MSSQKGNKGQLTNINIKLKARGKSDSQSSFDYKMSQTGSLSNMPNHKENTSQRSNQKQLPETYQVRIEEVQELLLEELNTPTAG